MRNSAALVVEAWTRGGISVSLQGAGASSGARAAAAAANKKKEEGGAAAAAAAMLVILYDQNQRHQTSR